MARFEIVFRSAIGEAQTMLVDDSTPERVSHLRQPLELGARITSNGNAWIVVEETIHLGLRRFVCDPVTDVSPAVLRVDAGTGPSFDPAPAGQRSAAPVAAPPADLTPSEV